MHKCGLKKYKYLSELCNQLTKQPFWTYQKWNSQGDVLTEIQPHIRGNKTVVHGQSVGSVCVSIQSGPELGPAQAQLVLCIFRNFLGISKNVWPRHKFAPKLLKFFVVAFDLYTQPWTKLQNEIQHFVFFRTG